MPGLKHCWQKTEISTAAKVKITFRSAIFSWHLHAVTHFCEIRELHNLYAYHGSYYKLEIKIVIQIPCMGILAQNVDPRKK